MVALIDMEIIGDDTSARFMCERLFAKLEPAPMAGWLLGYVEPILRGSSIEAFTSESDPKGNPWAPLAPFTIEDRISQGYTEGPIQYRSGELYRWFEGAQSDVNATQLETSIRWPGSQPTDDKMKYKIGSAQSGNARTGAPPRPVMGLTLQDAEKVMMGLFEYVVGVEL